MASRTSYTAAINPAFAGNGRSGGRGGQLLLSSSISSLSTSVSSRHGHPRHHHSQAGNSMSKIYRQASSLFLTRRLPEALSTLLPLLIPRPVETDGTNDTNGTNGSDAPSAAAVEPAPLASASRTTRVKVWSLYLTVLNAILELEPDEGKESFGTQEWRSLCAKVRDGDIWDEVVRNGYHGQEGDVDADVVINLATLLLAHAPSQAVNQKRLESYLSYSQMPNLDLSGHFDVPPSPRHQSRHRSATKPTPGTDTPRDLNARVKILELYTLHVLLRNDEWDYARDFISASPVLDEERREAFLQALQSLREEQQLASQREQEEREQHQQQLEDARRTRAENEEREQRRIEEERARREDAASEHGSVTHRHKAPSYAGRGRSSPSSRPSTANGAASATAATDAASAATPKGKGKANASLGSRTALIFHSLRTLVDQMGARFQASPMALVRTLLFISALLVMLGKRNVRERLARVLGSGWNKVRATAGMGVKVSYI
ncbi:peroxin 26 [Grosmannia clavigera kw1407]|uniref:Peroxin 26 n=1 Tax=Grosmannia clavigera (strain kw1407 / UAMH 11150) TaxID=655863 RepID=F0XSI8_GROCL|nr:peroxin 26 [Grosmannia clavigera kw1407]EFW99278.1 peroxin 26 [Grosmannia clavigera kw1407]